MLDLRTYSGKVYTVLRYLLSLYILVGVVVRVFNEGGSRSGKTFCTFDFLVDICMQGDRAWNIYVFRSTLQDCKEYSLADFKKKLILRGDYDPDCLTGENVRPDYRIGKSVIHFRGLDKMDRKEGYDCDIVYFNEMLDDISQSQFENITMRCTTMIIGDWNPKYTQHWAFDMEGQPDTFFTHTTYRDNPFCPLAVRRRIESYEPTPDNDAAGTSDPYRWNVYGLGMRAAQEGLIYPNINWIDSFPADLEHVILGLDFGFTKDPTALVRTAVRGSDLYAEKLLYSPIDDPEILYQAVKPFFTKKTYCFADSADKYASNPEGMINSLVARGLPVMKVNKYHGSLVDGIYLVKNFRLNFVRSRELQNEVNAYVWDSVNGIQLLKPKDGNDHLLDAIRYDVMSEHKNFLTT